MLIKQEQKTFIRSKAGKVYNKGRLERTLYKQKNAKIS